MTLDPADLDRVVRAALEEDLRYGPDVTTAAVIPPGTMSVADVVARQPGTLAGLPVVAAVLDVACPAATFTPQARDGDRVAVGDVVARVQGPLAEILTAERTLLNFLTHLSGIATATRAWVDAIDGTGALVRDTRKTVPGLRALEKYAVRCGGGVNHRMGLGDAALIKDNHIAAAGGVTAAFRAVLAAAPGVVAEVECDTLDQVDEALAAGAALILLDNMSLDQMRSAVAMARAYPAAKLEASGGLRLENARQVASIGVHYLSVGALTHSSPALDLALDVGLPAGLHGIRNGHTVNSQRLVGHRDGIPAPRLTRLPPDHPGPPAAGHGGCAHPLLLRAGKRQHSSHPLADPGHLHAAITRSLRRLILNSFDKEILRTMAAAKKYAEAYTGHGPATEHGKARNSATSRRSPWEASQRRSPTIPSGTQK
jgi:nicotinate-nucleotide pyrophosphorylase (carboxylating)